MSTLTSLQQLVQNLEKRPKYEADAVCAQVLTEVLGNNDSGFPEMSAAQQAQAQTNTGIRFHAVAYGADPTGTSDSLAAAQKAVNAAWAAGGGDVWFMLGTYKFLQYDQTQVPTAGPLTLTTNQISYTLIVPSGVRLMGVPGRTTLLLNKQASAGGALQSNHAIASPGLTYGYKTVSAVLPATSSTSFGVTVTDATSLAVGQLVQLVNPGSGAQTPSQEASPNQFFTIESISTNNIYFKEGPRHNYVSAQFSGQLKLAYPTSANFCTIGTGIEGLNFTAQSGTIPYVLMTRVLGGYFKDCNFYGVQWQWGTCENVRLDDVKTFDVLDPNFPCTIEATSVVSADRVEFHNSFFYVNDNCRQLHFKNPFFHGSRTGLSMLYCVQATLENPVFSNCTVAPLYDKDAALQIGYPLSGTYASKTAFNVNRYKTAQNNDSDIVVINPMFYGPSQRLIAVSNARLRVIGGYAEADFSQVGVININRTGATTSDATYFPSGGDVSVDIANIKCHNLGGSINSKWISTWYGQSEKTNEGWIAFTSTIAAGTASYTVDTAIPGSKPDFILRSGSAVNLLFDTGNDASINKGTISLTKTGANSVSITNSSGYTPAAGTKFSVQQAHDPRILPNVSITGDIDGTQVSFGKWVELYPYLPTGTGPYTGTTTITIPLGNWEVDFFMVRADLNSPIIAKVLVGYEGGTQYATLAYSSTGAAGNTVAVSSMTGGVLTLSLSNGQQTPICKYKLTPVKLN